MYRILIIEDEPLERAALCGAVERLYPSTVQVSQARDGQEALEKIEEDSPEVAMVDLNIPGISGLDLIQILKERDFPGKIIILTAYDTSSYIRQALSQGVLEYLLKPASMGEIKAALEKCFASLEKDAKNAKREEMHLLSKSYTQGKIWTDILSGLAPKKLLTQAFHWPEEEDLDVWLIRINGASEKAIEAANSLEEGGKLPLQVLKDEREGALRLLLRFTGEMQEKEGKESEENSRGKQGKIEDEEVSEEKSRVGKSVEEPPSLMGILLECLLCNLGTNEEPGVIYGPLKTYEQLTEAVTKETGPVYRHAYHQLGDKEAIEKLSAKWEGKLREGNAKSFVRMWKRKTLAGEEGLLSESFLLHASLFVHVLWSASQEEADYEELGRILLASKPYGELEEYLQRLMETSPGKENNQEDDSYLLNWMEEHYMEDITRADAARAMGLSESYFSVWFSQRTGTTFVNALQTVRIRHARERLDQGERDLRSIASDCGFYRYKTFGEVFKKVAGMSLTEYIAKLENPCGGPGLYVEGKLEEKIEVGEEEKAGGKSPGEGKA